MTDDLHAIIADQAETIDQLRAELDRTREGLGEARSKLHSYQRGGVEEADNGDRLYWSGVYDDIRSAWDAWAFAELGTASPTPLDLEGRPELAALWESVR